MWNKICANWVIWFNLFLILFSSRTFKISHPYFMGRNCLSKFHQKKLPCSVERYNCSQAHFRSRFHARIPLSHHTTTSIVGTNQQGWTRDTGNVEKEHWRIGRTAENRFYSGEVNIWLSSLNTNNKLKIHFQNSSLRLVSNHFQLNLHRRVSSVESKEAVRIFWSDYEKRSNGERMSWACHCHKKWEQR